MEEMLDVVYTLKDGPVGSIVLNTAGTWQLTELSGANYMISKTIVAAFVAVFWNYHLQRTFVFRANRNNQQA